LLKRFTTMDLFENVNAPQEQGIEQTEGSRKSGLTIIQKRIIETAVTVNTDPASIENASFLHSTLCQLGMPRKQIKERFFERRSGSAHLRLTAGVLWNGKEWIEKPVPYGVPPRMIMIYLCSEAIKSGKTMIDVGDSLHEFMFRLGRLSNDEDNALSGKKRIGGRTYAIFREQVEALAACELAIGVGNAENHTTIKVNPIDEFNSWLTNTGKEPGLWSGHICLSEKFFQSLGSHAVPIDTRTLKSIQHSPLAIDIYTWLVYRLCQIKDRNGIKLTWHNLKEQFGQEYRDVKDFKKDFSNALKQVTAVYQDAKIESCFGGLRFYNSPPPIPRKVTITLPSGM